MPECNGFLYKVRAGDTIVSISRKHRVRLAVLIKANSQLKDPTRLKRGEKICIPLDHGTKQVTNINYGVELPGGYKISKFTSNLTFPTGITFNDIGEMYVIESGYKVGPVQGAARVLKVNPDGSTTEFVRGFNAPVLGIAWYRGYLYISESGYPGQITKIASNGTRKTLIRGLPTGGDYGLGEIVFGPGDKMYFGVGSATNSGVVGSDNGWLAKRPKFHDLTCRSYELVGQNYVSENPLTPESGDITVTGAFQSFGVSVKPDQVVSRNFPYTGAVYEANIDGTGLVVYADGLRNPFGLGLGSGGNLFATDNGMDIRGSRPVADAPDTFEQVFPGEWYGWPDYSARIPLTDPRFKPPGGSQPQFLIKNHPPLAEGPVSVFKPHSVPTKFDFSTSDQFGFTGQAFIALFGHLYHEGKTLPEQAGFKVVRVNPETGNVSDFMTVMYPGAENKGPVHPIQAKFSPNSTELYVVDFGERGDTGKPPTSNSGAIWRITR